MAVKVYGVNRLIGELEAKFNGKRIERLTSAALEKGALVVGMEILRQLRTFKDKGYTIDEMTISDPFSDGNPTVIIYWSGPHNRYRIIHLNEWGTIRNPNPRGKGKIAKALKLSQKAYGKAVRDELRRSI